MKLKKMKIALFAMCAVLILGGNVDKAYAGRLNHVDNLRVSLKVRSGPSIKSTHITTLAADKDVVAGTDANSQKWVDEGGVNRLWKEYAYPKLSNGKYTNTTRGWMCSYESGISDSSYINPAGGAAITPSAGGYLYKNNSLTTKYPTKYPKGTTFGPGQYFFDHSRSNLNAWEVRPGGELKYMDGWLANAYNRK